MCDSSLVLPGDVVFDHSLSQPLLPSLRHACPGGARRWPCGLKVLQSCSMTGLSGFWLPSASAPLSQLNSAFVDRPLFGPG